MKKACKIHLNYSISLVTNWERKKKHKELAGQSSTSYSHKDITLSCQQSPILRISLQDATKKKNDKHGLIKRYDQVPLQSKTCWQKTLYAASFKIWRFSNFSLYVFISWAWSLWSFFMTSKALVYLIEKINSKNLAKIGMKIKCISRPRSMF